MNAVRKAVGDSGEEQRLIRTIARKGFRFVGAVSEDKLSGADEATKSALPTTPNETRHAPALALSDKPSIAVLPFQNLSGDAEQEYFADGMTEDIIAALSRMRWLFVIARNSSFTYKGRAVDEKQVRRDWACDMCWKEACARRRTGYALPGSSLQHQTARICGRIVLMVRSRISSICTTR